MEKTNALILAHKVIVIWDTHVLHMPLPNVQKVSSKLKMYQLMVNAAKLATIHAVMNVITKDTVQIVSKIQLTVKHYSNTQLLTDVLTLILLQNIPETSLNVIVAKNIKENAIALMIIFQAQIKDATNNLHLAQFAQMEPSMPSTLSKLITMFHNQFIKTIAEIVINLA